METKSRAYLCCVLGLLSMLTFGAALILQAQYPVPEGRHSALASAAGPIIFLMSIASLALAIPALIYGLKAVRSLSAGASNQVRVAAWVGTITGGLYVLMALALPVLVVAITVGVKVWKWVLP